jgi:hypothetical protein
MAWSRSRVVCSTSGIGEPAVQRKIDYSKAKWSKDNLPPDEFAKLLEKVTGEREGATFAVPYRDLFDALKDDTSIDIYIDEETPIDGARARFVLDTTTGKGGILRIAPPPDGATAAVLRDFAATLTHEMQHALDSIKGRFTNQEKPQTLPERKISSELRAFGREAAAALKLALGPTYPRNQGKLSAILPQIDTARLTQERNRLASEFHVMDSFRVAGRDPLDAFTQTGGLGIGGSKLLERVAGYLTKYQLVEGTASSQDALNWLKDNPEVVRKGLLEGVELFHKERPQAMQSLALQPDLVIFESLSLVVVAPRS